MLSSSLNQQVSTQCGYAHAMNGMQLHCHQALLKGPRPTYQGRLKPQLAVSSSSDAAQEQEQQPWRPQQQLELLQALQAPAQQLQQELSGGRTLHPRNGNCVSLQHQSTGRHPNLVVAAAAVAEREDTDTSIATAAAAALKNNAVLIKLQQSRLAAQLQEDSDSMPSNSSAALSSISTSSMDGSNGSSLRERLRQRVASRAGEDPPPSQHQQQQQQQHADGPSTPSSNDSSIESVLQSLNQRRARGYTKPGTRPGPPKAAAALAAANSSTGKPTPAAAAAAAAAAAVRASAATSPSAAASKAGKNARPRKGAAAGAGAAGGHMSPPSPRAIQLALNKKRRSPEAFAVLQQAAEAALQRAATPTSSNVQSSIQTDTEAGPNMNPAAVPRSMPQPAAASAAPGPSVLPAPSSRQKQQPQQQPLQQLRVPHGKAVSPQVAAVLSSSGAPEPVLRRLLHEAASWKQPSSPEVLQERLMQFDTAAQLLGGPKAATEILARDAAIMLMAPDVLQGKLESLEQLLRSDQGDEPQQQLEHEQKPQQDQHQGQLLQGIAALEVQEVVVLRQQADLEAVQQQPVDQQERDNQQHQHQQQECVVSEDVLALVASHPGILRLSTDRLSSRVEALQECLGLSSRREVLQVVRWQPRVLSMSSASMKLKAIALASVIGVPPTAIQDIFAKQPLLLNLSAKALVAKTRALKAALGYSDLQLWQVVFTKPGVLLFASNKLSSKWASLQELAGTHPRWTGELQQLSPSSLVQLLTASDTRLLRLQFLAEKQRQEKVPLYNSVVNLSDAKFVERYPGYTAWVAAHKHKASASV